MYDSSMVMKTCFSLKLTLVILTIIVTLALSKYEIFYVRPNSPANVNCPGDPCRSFNYYIKTLPQETHEGTIVMKLLEGYHIIHERSLNFGSSDDIEALHIIGNGPHRNKVVLYGLHTAIASFSVGYVLENFTAISSSIVTPASEYQTKNITILNCIFVKSSMILTNVNLTVIDSNFFNSSSTAVSLYSSTVTFIGKVRFVRNKGIQGGALKLIGTTMKVAKNANLYFKENHAKETGGAIFVINPEMAINIYGYQSPCFYQLIDYSNETVYHLLFVNNSAYKGGDHIYGASLKSNCFATFGCACRGSYDVVHMFFHFQPGYDSTFSAVSADATRVCVCDYGQPQCRQLVFYIEVYPGGLFSLPAVVVGGDYGTTTGTVYANFVAENSTLPALGSSDQQHQVITKSSECTTLTFSVYSKESAEVMFLTAKEATYKPAEEYYTENQDYDNQNDAYYSYESSGNDTGYYYYYEEIQEDYINADLRNAPIIFNIKLLPCPPGFSLLGELPGCDCHPVLKVNNVKCTINNLSGYHMWNSTSVWVQAGENSLLLFSTHCPFDYCSGNVSKIDLSSNPNAQCKFNHAGLLCGSCKEKFSLAIGSSHCIHCPSNKNVALLIFFAAAGVLLVFVIAVLNLTVTQGMINSLVFYANIIWAYQNVLFPPGFEKELTAHKMFIAWLNLDFGIETCFISGMTAYLKTWLQFIFPFYTATLFVVGVRYSSKLSKLFGDQSTPTLATIRFLSYSKLLRTIIACLQLTTYSAYSNYSDKETSTVFVWAVDGNLSYGQYPHVFLLLAAIAAFVLLWVPYTFLIFSMQWLRRIDHHGPLKVIVRYKPLYDAYFAPMKDKHQYWFGVLLIVQGLLLVVSSLTTNTLPALSILLLLVISIILLCYLNSIRVYKRLSVSLLECSFLINFITLTVGHLYFRDNEKGRMVLLSLSITVAFLEFCGIVIWNLIPQKMKQLRVCAARNTQLEDEVYTLQQYEDRENERYACYSDYIDSHNDPKETF